jgi:hypothetical protein
MSLERDVEKIVEAGIFKPAPRKEVAVRQAAALQNLATPEVRDAIRRVVEYLWEDEVRNWEENSDSDKEYEEGDVVDKEHILYSLIILANAAGL